MSAPCSIGRIRAGEARVLSTTSGRLWRRATAAIPSRSTTDAQGFTIDSQKMARQSGVMATSKSSGAMPRAKRGFKS